MTKPYNLNTLYVILFICMKHNTDESSKMGKPLQLVTANPPTILCSSPSHQASKEVSVPVQLIWTSAKVMSLHGFSDLEYFLEVMDDILVIIDIKTFP